MVKLKQITPSANQMREYATLRKSGQVRRSADVRYGAGIGIVSDQDLDG